MEREVLLKKIKDKLANAIINWQDRSPKRVYVDVKLANILEAVKYLFKDLSARFITASGVDTPRGIEILYHFSFDGQNLIVSLRTTLERSNPEIDSITPIVNGAEWIEREIWELLGVKFRNHPNLKRLLLSEDWPEGVYPLRQKRKNQ